MRRREFLTNAGMVIGATTAATPTLLSAASSAQAPEPRPSSAKPAEIPLAAADWNGLRDLFPLDRSKIHLATFLLASHPAPVSKLIETHRTGFDANPAEYYHEFYRTKDMEVAQSAAAYMGGDWTQIALTDSTTMGLAMVYSGLLLGEGDEILQTEHDHYSTDMSLAHKAKRCGAKVKRIALYDEAAAVSVSQCQKRLREGITKKTRVVAVTWVHSSTGVKLPIKALSEVIATVNAKRDEEDKIVFCVDGVHGFGIEDQDVSELGCDFFIAGTHKWMFGPRGTGVVWGSKRGWSRSEPVIPGFSVSYAAWLGLMPAESIPPGMHFTPGGFHSFEHRWALPAAFQLHMDLGKEHIQARIHALNTQTKEGLAKMSHVTLHTPSSSELSSGLVCFEVAGVKPAKVTEQLLAKGIIMSSTPYRTSYARFAPSLINNEAEIDKALAEIQALG